MEFAVEGLPYYNRISHFGLLTYTFANAIEFIVAIIALMNGEIRVVQASIKGRQIEQKFNSTASLMSSSLMTLACITLLLPTALYSLINGTFNLSSEDITISVDDKMLHISYGMSIALLVVYALYLWFQLKTHKSLVTREIKYEDLVTREVKYEDLVTPEFLVRSIKGIVKSLDISETFIGLILIPMLGNFAEVFKNHIHSTSIAMKDNMNLAIGITIGGSAQVALFIIPILVIFGWIIGQPMSLLFLPFEAICLLIAVLLKNQLIQTDVQIGLKNDIQGVL
ncbi:23430_t:CDS:2 [Racocetra persica]|uniref:23430_t:CDS:1 n=1 Tax=Racocetra persica TaxID=160502 RepID=A0ACA9LGQ2_9GLOM|nr:23430_t:CDS:2 [Racocetra persica]